MAMLESESKDGAHSSSSSDEKQHDLIVDSPSKHEHHVRVESFKRRVSARKLVAQWHLYQSQARTTRSLALAFVDIGISSFNPMNEPRPTTGWSAHRLSFSAFDEFSAKARDPSNIKKTQAFTTRLEQRLMLLKTPLKFDPLPILKLVNPPTRNGAQASERYPARILLSAFMISAFPDIVLDLKNGKKEGTKEHHLQLLASSVVDALESVIARVLNLSDLGEKDQNTPVSPSPLTEGINLFLEARKRRKALESSAVSPADLLLSFDEAWFSFLVAFHDWKSQDSAKLEASLIAMAVEMEKSLRRKIALPPPNVPPSSPSRPWDDIKAMEQQVADDHQVLRDKVAQLGGQEALERLDNALHNARWEVEEEIINKQASPPASRSAPTQGLARGFFNSPKANAPPPPPQAAPTTGLQRLSPQEFSNLIQVNDLLHNPNSRVPTSDFEKSITDLIQPHAEDVPDPKAPLINTEELQGLGMDQAVFLIRTRAKAIAEKAFWSEVTFRMLQGVKSNSALMVLQASVPLVAEASLELLASLGSGPTAKRLKAQLFLIDSNVDFPVALETDVDDFISRLLQSGSNQPHVLPESFLQLLEVLGRNICALGAPARQRKAEEAQAQLKKELGEGLSALVLARGEEADRAQAAVADTLARCIRLLHYQIKILKIDIANHRLSSLYESLSSGGYSGCDYVRGRFREMYDLGPRVLPSTEDPDRKPHLVPTSVIRSNLPNTSAWLSESLHSVKATMNYVSAFGGGLDIDLVGRRVSDGKKMTEGSKGSAPPQITMRAGRGPVQQPAQGNAEGSSSASVPEPTSFDSTEDMVMRHALVSLVSEGALSSFPETLLLDAQKISALQNEFQGLSVLATCLLLSHQMAKGSQRVVDRSRLEQAKRRLLILFADQSMDLDSLACEIAASSGDDSAPQVEKSKKALQALLNVEGPAYKSLSRAISACLFAQVMLPRASEANEASMKILGRVGVGIVAEDVEHLSSKLSDFISVHGSIFLSEAYAPLLQQPTETAPAVVDEI